MEIAVGTKQRTSVDLSPMSLWQSVGFFGIPWLLLVVAVYVLLPALDHAGTPLFLNFLISLGIPLGLLLIASCVAYRLEGRPWAWNECRDRFRLGAMKPSAWLGTTFLAVFMFLASSFLSFSSAWIQQIAPVPAHLSRMFDLQAKTFMGTPLAGAWWIFLGYLLYLVVNVLGEELWWRGYVLPRQELAFGKWAWLVHGIFWTLFHSFFYWEFLALFPGCLALSFVASKYRNTWPGIIAHFAISVPTLVFLAVGVWS